MEDSYIKDYILNLMENVYNNDIERLKAINIAIDYVANNIYNNDENASLYYGDGWKCYNQLSDCTTEIEEVIKKMEEKKEND